MKATIFDIQRNSYVDGPGIRTTVFFKGCNLKCKWCHNPESQSGKVQMMFYASKCTGCGKCKEVCPYSLEKCDFCGRCTIFCPNDARKVCGKEYTVDEVLKEVVKDKTFYETSGGGVTFSGGECMLQTDFLVQILKKCKEEGIYTAVDTAGCVPWEHFEKVIPYTDLFLYDIKCMDNEAHKKWVGADNTLILDNLKKLLKSDAHIWVRVPVIGGVNDSTEEMQKIKAFFDENGYPEKVELLPYHAMGEHKYSAIGKEVTVFEVPDKDKMEKLKKIFGV